MYHSFFNKRTYVIHISRKIYSGGKLAWKASNKHSIATFRVAKNAGPMHMHSWPLWCLSARDVSILSMSVDQLTLLPIDLIVESTIVMSFGFDLEAFLL